MNVVRKSLIVVNIIASLSLPKICIAVDCSGIIVKRAIKFQSYPTGSECNDMPNEVVVGPSTVTFQDGVVQYNPQNEDTVYNIYVNSQTPITIQMGQYSHPENVTLQPSAMDNHKPRMLK